MCLKSDQPHEDTLWREESSDNTRNSPLGQQAAPETAWKTPIPDILRSIPPPPIPTNWRRICFPPWRRKDSTECHT